MSFPFSIAVFFVMDKMLAASPIHSSFFLFEERFIHLIYRIYLICGNICHVFTLDYSVL